MFETKKGRKRAKLSTKERIEMSALMPVQENEKDEDEKDDAGKEKDAPDAVMKD